MSTASTWGTIATGISEDDLADSFNRTVLGT